LPISFQVLIGYENRDDSDQDFRNDAADGDGNFNTWDLAQSFEGADSRYQLAVVVVQYAELRRQD